MNITFNYIKILTLFFILFNTSYASAALNCNSVSDLETALRCLCVTLYDYVSIVAFMMINLASVIYALGNLFGAETRARANVWATSMLTGAIIGIVLIIIVPAFIATLLGLGNFNADTCCFGSC